MFNRTIIVGRLGAAPEMRFLQNGTPIASFSVATEIGTGESKKTLWYKVTAWRKLAETCNEYLEKGSLVLVEGVETEPYVYTPRGGGEAKAQLQLTASTVRFLSTKREQARASASAGDEYGEPIGGVGGQEEEIPF
jgi:single-strand DNA-binding protein